MNYIFLATVTGDFAAEHPNLNGLLKALEGWGRIFGNVADNLSEITVDVSKSTIATALTGIGTGLVTFFMVLEIITYCFNVDFHAGFESAMKIGVKTVLMYIIVENCMDAGNAVIGIFKFDKNLNFTLAFSTIANPLKDMFNNITPSENFIMKMIEPYAYGIILVFLFLVLTVLFSMIIVSLIGIIMETTILTTIAPVACATRRNHKTSIRSVIKMIRAQIPQDVTDYKEEFIFGLTLRKLISVVSTILLVAVIYFIGKNFVDTSIIIYFAAILSAPIVLIGFKSINGMPFEKYAELIWNFFTKEQRRKFIYIPEEEKNSLDIKLLLLTGEKMLRKDEIQKIKKQEKLNRQSEKRSQKLNKERKHKDNAN